MKEPNFFIAGAPKCGTTSLADWLSSHPEIFMSSWKEPHFFSTDFAEPDRPTCEEYSELFAGAGEHHKAVGEASVWYLASHKAIPAILERNPTAKFIACVRNPIEMAYSLHNQSVFAGTEPIADFREAWRAQPDRAQGKRVPNWVEPATLQYGPLCKLGEQVARAIHHAGREAIHVVFLSDMKRDPATVYLSLLRFLGVSSEHRPEFRVVNRSGKRKLPLLPHLVRKLGDAKRALGIKGGLGVLRRVDDWNRQPHQWQADAAMTAELTEYFRDDVELLASLTNRDLSHWLAGPAKEDGSDAALQDVA